MKKVFALLFLAGVVSLASCKKEEKVEETTVETPVEAPATEAPVDSAATDSAAAPADTAKKM